VFKGQINTTIALPY